MSRQNKSAWSRTKMAIPLNLSSSAQSYLVGMVEKNVGILLSDCSKLRSLEISSRVGLVCWPAWAGGMALPLDVVSKFELVSCKPRVSSVAVLNGWSGFGSLLFMCWRPDTLDISLGVDGAEVDLDPEGVRGRLCSVLGRDAISSRFLYLVWTPDLAGGGVYL